MNQFILTREEFCFLALGRAVSTAQTIDKKELESYVEGAKFTFDFLEKQKRLAESKEKAEEKNV